MSSSLECCDGEAGICAVSPDSRRLLLAGKPPRSSYGSVERAVSNCQPSGGGLSITAEEESPLLVSE